MSPSTATTALPPNLTTRTQLLSPISLNASPHLPALFKLINHCFNISHNPSGHSYLPYSPTTRLKTHSQLSEEIGPDGFTIIMLAQDTSTQTHIKEKEEDRKQEGKSNIVIATASAKPYTPPPSNSNNSAGLEGNASSEKLFKRQPGTDTALTAYAALPKWEILCMVVEPTLQGRGIAGQIMGETIDEVKRRVVAEKEEGEGQEKGGYGGQGDGGMDGDGKYGKDDDDDNGKSERGKGKGEVLLMLSSMQELNEEYYKKRGWETTGVRRFPKGTMGSREGFGVVEMMRVVSF